MCLLASLSLFVINSGKVPDTEQSVATPKVTTSGIYKQDSKIVTATASWYGEQFHGRLMANGQKFNMYDPTTVAHKTLPFGTRVVFVNPENGVVLSAIVKDRGPYVKDRSFDLSYAAARKLGFVPEGTARLKVYILS